MSTVEKVVTPMVSPLRSFLSSRVTATLENSIMPQAMVRMTMMYLARMLSIAQNAGKKPFAGSSCMALTRKSIPNTTMTHASVKRDICTFSLFPKGLFISSHLILRAMRG